MIVLLRCARTANRAEKNYERPRRAPCCRTACGTAFASVKRSNIAAIIASVDPSITKVSDFEITIGKYVPFAPRENYRQN